jgi:hypothetical protein
MALAGLAGYLPVAADAGRIRVDRHRRYLQGKQSGHLFIWHASKAYAIAPGVASGTFRLAVPGDPSQPGDPVTRNASGEWELGDGAGSHESARASSASATYNPAYRPVDRGNPRAGSSTTGDVTPSVEERAIRSLLTHPSDAESVVANRVGLPVATSRKIVADLGDVRGAWFHASASEAQAAPATDTPLTPRENAFIDRRANELSANHLAELMQWPLPKINAYLQSDEHRSATQASGSHETPGLPQAPAGSQGERVKVRNPGSGMAPEKRDRTVNPTMKYVEIAKACSSSAKTVSELARVNGLQRTPQSVAASVRSDLIDDFILFPETGVTRLARVHDVSGPMVKALRDEFGRIRRDWDAVRSADILERRPELLASLPDKVKSFIDQWGARCPLATSRP